MTRINAAQLSRIIVGAVIGSGVLYLAWSVLPLWAFIPVALLLLYEGWTLINKDEEDTLSEAVAYLTAKQPLVPWLFGNANMFLILGVVAPGIIAAAAAGDTGHVVRAVMLICALALLQGHFFFTMQKIVLADDVARLETAAETGIILSVGGEVPTGTPK